MTEGSIKVNGAFRPDWEPRLPAARINVRGHFWISSFEKCPQTFSGAQVRLEKRRSEAGGRND